MNSNDFRLISVIVCAALYFLNFIFVPIKIKVALKNSGKKIISVKKKKIFLQVLIMIFSALLILMVWLRDLGIFTDIIICLVAVLGCAMSLNEIFMNRFCGLYENGLAGNGRFFSFGQILSVKNLSYSDSGEDGISSRILILTTAKNHSEQFIFSSEEERKSIQDEILKRNPGISC